MSGVLTVARIELKVRVRAGRWRWLLAAWFVILVGFTALLRLALSAPTTWRETSGPSCTEGSSCSSWPWRCS